MSEKTSLYDLKFLEKQVALWQQRYEDAVKLEEESK